MCVIRETSWYLAGSVPRNARMSQISRERTVCSIPVGYVHLFNPNLAISNILPTLTKEMKPKRHFRESCFLTYNLCRSLGLRRPAANEIVRQRFKHRINQNLHLINGIDCREEVS